MEQEQWRPVRRRTGMYEVSDQGRVRTASDHVLLSQHRAGGHGGRGKYQRVWHQGENCALSAYVHVLVLEAFVGRRPDGAVARHLNDNADDNRLENLAWGTYSDNAFDKVRNGLHHHTQRTHCPKGHPLDGISYRRDGSVRQRHCKTCESIRQKVRKAKKTHCAKGHPLEEAKVRADGSRYRTCKVCAAETLKLGHGLMGKRTHCKYGHPLDGQYARQRYCKTCKSEAKRRAKAKA